MVHSGGAGLGGRDGVRWGGAGRGGAGSCRYEGIIGALCEILESLEVGSVCV